MALASAGSMEMMVDWMSCPSVDVVQKSLTLRLLTCFHLQQSTDKHSDYVYNPFKYLHNTMSSWICTSTSDQKWTEGGRKYRYFGQTSFMNNPTRKLVLPDYRCNSVRLLFGAQKFVRFTLHARVRYSLTCISLLSSNLSFAW